MDKKAFKGKTNKPKEKKKLIRTKSESTRLKIIVTVVILLISAITYYLIDSGSYVASVAGNRISRAEFQFFLSQQVAYTEYSEGLTTDKEKKDFWTTPADGRDPWEEAKSKALDLSKEYMIQLIKAHEMGLKVDSAIKNDVSSLMKSLQGQLSDMQFYNYIKESYNMSPGQLQKIYEKLSLIQKFKEKYLEKNYNPKPLTDDEVKAYYDEDPKKFDDVDISYVSLYKYDDKGNDLTKEQIEEKKKIAEKALSKIQQGENMDDIIKEYSEDKKEDTKTDEKDTEPIGKTTISYSEGSSIQNLIDWVFDNKPGDAGIVETDNVIYVVKIDSRTTFDDVKEEVKTTMENDAREKFYDDAINSWSLEPKYNIIKNDRVYESISYN